MGHFWFDVTISVLALLALITILVVLLLMYGAIKKLIAMSEKSRGQIETILQETQELAKKTKESMSIILDRTQESVNVVTTTAREITDITREQVIEARALGRDTVLKARNKVERLDDLADNALARVDDTISTIQKQVLAPVREFHCLTVGVRRAVETLINGRPRPISREREYPVELSPWRNEPGRPDYVKRG